MKIAIIAAVSKNNVIGINGILPWKIREELSYFREKTLNKPIIMGSNTFRSINFNPLPGRYNIVLTSSPEQLFAQACDLLEKQQKPEKIQDLVCAKNIEEALLRAKQFYLTKSNRCELNAPPLCGEMFKESLEDPPSLLAAESVVLDNVNSEIYNESNHNLNLVEGEINPDVADIQQIQEIMIIGGAKIYQQFLPLADKLYLSIIKQDYSGDVFFPKYDLKNWELISSSEYPEFTTIILDKI